MYNTTLHLKNLIDTQNFASALGKSTLKGDIFLLNGDIGSGKTTFSQFFINSLCPNEKVSSPTFSIINEYDYSDFKIYHMDLYRIKNQDELFELGFEELIQNNVCLIEWAVNTHNYPIKNPIQLYFNQHNGILVLSITCASQEQYGRFNLDAIISNK